MKLFVPFILILFYQSREVVCFEAFNYVFLKINEVKNSILSLIRVIRDPYSYMAKLLNREEDESTFRNKKGFSYIVAGEASKIEKEFPEYFSLRSEPTALMSTPQLATLHGKRIETHVVLTYDGYFLTLHRLRRSLLVKKENKSNITGYTVLMHHGLLGSSTDWILLGPEKSLPYILANAGCDVWLTNARGNYYSRKHTSLNVDSLEYWKFSWEQMGKVDLPAIVDYIHKIKNSTEKLNFIGHSMGATAFLVMLSVNPRYNAYFRMGILLAPLVYMTNIVGPLRYLKSAAKRSPVELLKVLGEGEFVPNRIVPPWIANKHCKGPDLYCSNPLLFLSGSIPEKNSWSKNFTARVLYHVPAGGSTDTILHYAALVKTGKFNDFYNAEYYEFPLHRVSVPIALFSSNDDWLATTADVLHLYFKIANPIEHYVIQGAKLTHTDFVWHPDADSLVFPKVVQCLESDLNYFVYNKNPILNHSF